jgi:hypothetical protein
MGSYRVAVGMHRVGIARRLIGWLELRRYFGDNMP